MKPYILLMLLPLTGLPLLAQDLKPISEEDCRNQPDSLNGQKVLIMVDEPPEYKGGMSEFYRLLSKNLSYPKSQQEFQGRVFVKFVIDTLGRIRGGCIAKRFDQKQLTPVEIEALRLISVLDDWVPGRHEGRKVPVKMIFPIHFGEQR